VHDNTSLSINLGTDTNICPGQTKLLNPGNFSSYLWQDNSTQPTFAVTQTGIYSVDVTDANGCTGHDEIEIIVDCSAIHFPSAFTPNGDAKNELFGPAGNNLYAVSSYSLDVYNRYGELAFHSNDPFKKWDGKFKGKVSGNETFVWMASYKLNGKEEFQKGTVTLIK
jgi:gliding motility-associated-like protein